MKIKIIKQVTGPFQENSYLVFDTDTKKGVCIDPGDEPQLLMELIETHDCKPLAIINTHAHLDHVGGVAELKKAYSIPFYLHEHEKMILDIYEDSCRIFQMPVGEKPPVDHWISQEKNLQFDALNFDVIYTPGHTPGGLTFMIADHVFVGDTLFLDSVGRTDLPGGDWDVLQSSLMNLINSVPEDFIIHSGHGPDTTMGREKKENYFLIPLLKNLNSAL